MVPFRFVLLASALALFSVAHAEPIGTSFTYQGTLEQQNAPATGMYDFKFELFDAEFSGNSVSTSVLLENATVDNGVFTVELDFGDSPFNGDQRWLEISVREGASAGPHTLLAPRQKLTATPYAMTSIQSIGSLPAGCTAIASLPYIINTEGVYCFTGNLETNMLSGEAITINADNVVIDLNGWALDGLSAGVNTETRGFYAYSRKYITIRNGTIRGFFAGILLLDYEPTIISKGHLIEDIRAETNFFYAVYVSGADSTVRRNQISGIDSNDSYGSGIILSGPRGRILDNDISSITASGSAGLARAISVQGSDDAIVESNRINNIFYTGGGQSYGVIIYNSADVFSVGNTISNIDGGGLFYNPSGAGSTGKYMDNLTSNVTTPFIGGTPIGINN